MTIEDHPELEQTQALADGELTGAALERAQDHLATCERCQTELADIMQLEAMPMPSIAAGVTQLSWYRKRPVQIASMLVAAAAATVLIVGTRKHKPITPETPTRIALASKRSMEARLSWQGAADYREYSVQRGSTLAKEPISLSTLADLEKAGDLHGVGALALLGGDLEQAKKYLALAGDSPEVLADHAALELQLGDPEGALVLADAALARVPDQMTATWNRGLALRELGLRHDAADAFRVVAKHSEPGWATEATQRADELERGFLDELALTQRVTAAATPLAQTGTGLSLDDARRLPGLARIELYDALRAAPTAEAVAKLKPLAEAIDSAGGAGAAAAVAGAKPDPAVAKAYLSLLTDDKPDRAHILGVLRSAHADDAVVVALLKFDESEVPDADLPELTKLAAASSDAWIRLIGIEQRAGNAFRKNDLPAAEAALLGASEMCKSGAPSYRCMKISMLLGQTYTAWQRLPEARTALADAWARARALSQWEQDDILVALTDLAVVADDIVGGGLPLVHAYTSELAARAKIEEKQGLRDNACDVERWGHERVAQLLLIQLRTPDAARELGASPTCKVSHRTPAALITGIYVRAELLHVAGKPADVAGLQTSIAEMRATDLPIGERALLDHAEGRAVIGSDAAAGDALLHRAITVGASAPHSDDGGAAVGLSYAVLAIAAAKRGDAPAALGLLADELGIHPRATCVLGLAVDDGDVAVLARGNDGKALVDTYERTTTALVASKVVPGRVIEALRGCVDVDVIARPPYHGLAQILPDDFAWRYVTPRQRPIGAPTGSSLVIADVRPPQALGLPHLAAWNNTGNATEITGAAATPSRVLAAIGEARDVVIHAHGLADHGDASYLALSPEGEDRYALTAGEVARARFKTSPLVILAACEAARSAPVFHKRWSLPAAFVTAGARAVVAPTSAVPDDGAAKFFDELRTRTAAGQPVAAVVRDLRKAWLSDSANNWVRDIVVFE